MGNEMRPKDFAEATAKARSIAYNKNWNILYDPPVSGGCSERAQLPDDGQKPEDLIAPLFNEKEDENEASARAEGKAVVVNRNINVVIYW